MARLERTPLSGIGERSLSPFGPEFSKALRKYDIKHRPGNPAGFVRRDYERSVRASHETE
jgi:hypothetical protein